MCWNLRPHRWLLIFLLFSLGVNVYGSNTTSTSSPTKSTTVKLTTASPITASPTKPPTSSPTKSPSSLSTSRPTPSPLTTTTTTKSPPTTSPTTTTTMLPSKTPTKLTTTSSHNPTSSPTPGPTPILLKSCLPIMSKYYFKSNKEDCGPLIRRVYHINSSDNAPWDDLMNKITANDTTKAEYCLCKPAMENQNEMNITQCLAKTKVTCPTTTSTNSPSLSETKNMLPYLFIGGVIMCLFGGVLYCLRTREAGGERLLKQGNDRGGGGGGYDRQSNLAQDSGSDTDENLMMPRQPPRRIGTEVVGAVSDVIESIGKKIPRRPKPRKEVVVRPPTAGSGYQAANSGGTELTDIVTEPQFGLGDSDDDDESSESDEELLAIRERQRAKKRERELKRNSREPKKGREKKRRKRKPKEQTGDFDPRGDNDGDLFLDFAPDCDE